MKILLTVLFISLVFSANLHAKKVKINYSSPGTVYMVPAEGGCLYQCVDNSFQVSYHVHSGVSVALKVLYGEEAINVQSTDMTRTHNGGQFWCRNDFFVPNGQDWSLIWVLEKGTNKTHVIDAAEMTSGSCSP